MQRTGQLLREKRPLSSQCSKSSRGGDTERIRNCDHCCEDAQVPLRAHGRRSGNDVNGMVTYWDLGYWYQYVKRKAPNHIQNDQLKLCYLPKVSIPLKKAGVNM